MRTEDRELFGEPAGRLDQRVEPAAGQKLIQATETNQHALLDLAIHPLVIHDKQIDSGTVGLSANEQSDTPVSLSCPQDTANNKNNLRFSVIMRDTRISSWRSSLSAESITCGHFGSQSVEDELETDGEFSGLVESLLRDWLKRG